MRNERKKRYLQKVIITFLSLILNLSNFKFNCKPYLQTMGSTIVQSVLLPTQTYLWQVSKQNTSLHILTAYLWYGKAQKAESIAFIKDPTEKHKLSNLTFNFHQEKLHLLMQCYIKTEVIISKQLYIANRKRYKHSYTLSHSSRKQQIYKEQHPI